MRKVFFEFTVLLFVLATLCFSLSRIQWTTIFRINESTEVIEKKLGDFYWDYFSATKEEITNPSVTSAIETILIHICESNDIDSKTIKIHIIEDPTVNAFAFPDKRIVLCSGLIREVSGEDELAGVISHEIAHIELNHVMKKLIKEFGLAILSAMVSGSGGEFVAESVRLLSSSAYDRKMEKEADIQALEYMIAAHLEPEGLANFLDNLEKKEPDYYKYMTWANTHPETGERVEYLLTHVEKRSPAHIPIQLLTSEVWNNMQNTLFTYSTEKRLFSDE